MSGARAAAVLTALGLLLAVASPATASAADWWKPRATTEAWQWQLKGKIDLSVEAPVYDIDGAEASRSTVRALHGRGRRAICYFSAGSYEPYRSDRGRIPRSAIGRRLEGFPDERWLDIRRIGALKPVMRSRLDMCARKGFDAVEPDNVDGYRNRSGIPLRGSQQLRFNSWLARAAHARGLGVGLKNDTAQVRKLARSFDFAVVEQCVQYRECRGYSPFVRRGKPVFAAEYSTGPGRFCPVARRLGFSFIGKRLALGPQRRTCGG